MSSVVKLFQLFEFNEDGPLSMPVIEKLQSCGIIVKNNSLKCKNGHFAKLCPRADYTDGFVWRCRERSSKNNKKKGYV